MPSKTDVSKKAPAPLTEIEKDFLTFYNECSTSNMNTFQLLRVLWPLKIRMWKKMALKYGVIILLTVIFLCLAFYVDFFAWNLAAVGRLILGKLRSIWNWEDLYKAKCLIGKSPKAEETFQGSKELERNILDYKDCVVCENIGKCNFFEKY